MDVKEQWIKTGTEYAEKSWPYTYNRMGKSDIYNRLRNITKGVIAQEALGHLLDYFKIHYKTKPRERWYEVNRFDYLVETEKEDINIDIKSFFIPISNPELGSQGEKYFIDCEALIPKDQLEGREMNDNDVYVFAFLIGREIKICDSPSLFPLKHNWLLHCMWEYEFFKPPIYQKDHGSNLLGCIKVVGGNSIAEKTFVIGGTKEPHKYITEKIELNKTGNSNSKNEFFQLFFIRSLNERIPDVNISITTSSGSPRVEIPHLYGFSGSSRNGWSDIWIYEGKIYFVGLALKKEFKELSKFFPRFSKSVKQFETKTDNYGVNVRNLPHPISDLSNIMERGVRS